jgi:hypothetical protein
MKGTTIALLAVAGVAAFLWIRSRGKSKTTAAGAPAAPGTQRQETTATDPNLSRLTGRPEARAAGIRTATRTEQSRAAAASKVTTPTSTPSRLTPKSPALTQLDALRAAPAPVPNVPPQPTAQPGASIDAMIAVQPKTMLDTLMAGR